MKSLFFVVCLCVIVPIVLGSVSARQLNDTFIMELADVALDAIKSHSDLGHRLMSVEEIDNISRASVQNSIKVLACRYKDINQKKELEAHPEKKVTLSDFNDCESCKFKLNKTENGVYIPVQFSCVL